MADEIKNNAAETPAKDKKKADSKKKADAQKEKKGNFFVRVWKAIKKFCKDLKGECKKVVWPNSKTVIKSTAVVLACVAVLGVVIWLVDTGLSEIVKLLINLAKDASADSESALEATKTVATGLINGFFGA